MTKRKKKLEIKKWGKSLIKRMESHHDYLHNRMEIVQKKESKKAEMKLILEYKNLLRDIQLFIEKDL